jgi:hypothetical protein
LESTASTKPTAAATTAKAPAETTATAKASAELVLRSLIFRLDGFGSSAESVAEPLWLPALDGASAFHVDQNLFVVDRDPLGVLVCGYTVSSCRHVNG